MSVLPAHAAGMVEVDRLAGLGAPNLALSVLEQEQPSLEQDPITWMRWERRRVRLLADAGQWRQLDERLATTPATLPRDFRHWATTWRAKARLADARPAAARALLRAALWREDAVQSAEFPHWRRLIIDAYLREGRLDDAATALARYRQDYGTDEAALRLLEAELLLRTDRPEAAARVLNGADGGEAAPLRALARLRGGEGDAAEVMAAAKAHRGDVAWAAVGAEAARLQGDFGAEVQFLESALGALETEHSAAFALSPERLWRAYLDFAQKVANRERLLIGDDSVWLRAADRARSQEPVKSRSLYALLSLEALHPATRERAAGAFLEQLLGLDGGERLLRRLYLHAPRFGDLRDIPLAARRVLIDDAIARGDVQAASKLLHVTPEPETEAERVTWQLRRARVFIYAGDYAAGAEALQTLVDNREHWEGQNLDRLIQVIFDLQAVKAHDAAARLLEGLYPRVEDLRIRREILFWLADSRLAQGRQWEAARLYLRSAALPGPNTLDPWAQTARYKGAQALAEAGYLDDARALYRGLLEVTEEPTRRAVLNREIQGLWLKRDDVSPD